MTPFSADATQELAPSQQMMWEFMLGLNPANPGSSQRVVFENVTLTGQLDAVVLLNAMRDVIAHHELLRTRFTSTGLRPQMEVLSDATVPLKLVDYTDIRPEEQRALIAAAIEDDHSKPFQLCEAPLWRALLIRTAAHTHVLAVTFFHMVSDGWSCKVFIEDLMFAYESRLVGKPFYFATPSNFRSIQASQDRLQGTGDGREEFWRNADLYQTSNYQFFPALPISTRTDLAAERPLRFSFPTEVTSRLRALARAARSTPYVILFAAWATVLARRAGREKLTIGSTTLGRETATEQRIIGQFTNNIYVTAHLVGEMSFLECANRIHHQLAAAMSNVLDFYTIARAVHPRFDDERPWPDNHLFDAWFQAAAPPSPGSLRTAPVTVSPTVFHTTRRVSTDPALSGADVSQKAWPVWAKCGSPTIVVDADRKGAALMCNQNLFTEEFLVGLVADYITTLELVSKNPTVPIQAVKLPVGTSFN